MSNDSPTPGPTRDSDGLYPYQRALLTQYFGEDSPRRTPAWRWDWLGSEEDRPSEPLSTAKEDTTGAGTPRLYRCEWLDLTCAFHNCRKPVKILRLITKDGSQRLAAGGPCTHWLKGTVKGVRLVPRNFDYGPPWTPPRRYTNTSRGIEGHRYSRVIYDEVYGTYSRSARRYR